MARNGEVGRRQAPGSSHSAAANDDTETARQVIDAAVACILECGFYRASTNEIARRGRDMGRHPVLLRDARG